MFTTFTESKTIFIEIVPDVQCLIDVQCQSRIQAQKELASLAISNFPIPGDADFPLTGMFAKPSPGETGLF